MVSPGVVLVAIFVSLSAMSYWAFTIQVNGIRLPPVVRVPLLVGDAGTVVPAIVFSASRSSENTRHTFDRQFAELRRGFRSRHTGKMQPTLRVLSSATTRPPNHEQPELGGRVIVAHCR